MDLEVKDKRLLALISLNAKNRAGEGITLDEINAEIAAYRREKRTALNPLSYKGYMGYVEYSETDGVYFGRIEGIDGLVNFEGPNVKELTEAFHNAVEEYLAFVAKRDSLEEGRKIVFLDCDGVVNSTQWEVRRDMSHEPYTDDAIDPRLLQRIVDVCKTTGAAIVLSSDWRINWPSARKRLERAGVPEGMIIDRTPVLNAAAYSRGEEVKAWLDDHDDVRDYIIIDDREDFLPDQIRHLVHTSNWIGFSGKDKKKAIELLAGD